MVGCSWTGHQRLLHVSYSACAWPACQLPACLSSGSHHLLHRVSFSAPPSVAFRSGLACYSFFRYYWFIVSLEVCLIFGLAGVLASGAYAKFRNSFLGLFCVVRSGDHTRLTGCPYRAVPVPVCKRGCSPKHVFLYHVLLIPPFPAPLLPPSRQPCCTSR